MVEDKKVEIATACQHYGVERLDLFGSATGEEFDPARSDLDFVVSFERREPPNLFDRYFGLKEDLENLFGREVDLVMEGALRKDRRFAEGVNQRRVALYAA
jgi:predicted nucleotidyltransferase